MAFHAVWPFLVACVAAFFCQASAQLPSGCTNRYQRVECITRNYTFPETFNVAGIPSDVAVLVIGQSHVAARNLISPSFSPLPSLRSLYGLVLNGFQDDMDDSFPLNNFLMFVKSGLTELTIVYGVLRQLTMETFNGFGSLQYLTVAHTDLRSVALDSFFFRPYLAGAAPPSVNSLIRVSIYGNNIAEMDWSLFAPHAGSLQTINLANNQLTTLSLSNGFRIRNINSLSLDNNNLTFIPFDILRLLDRAPIQSFQLRNNSFCRSDPDCRCCEVEPVVSWIHYAPLNAGEGQFSCGSGEPCGPGNNESVCVQQYSKTSVAAMLPQFNHCPPENCPAVPVCASITEAPQTTKLPDEDALLTVSCSKGHLSHNAHTLEKVQSVYFHGDNTLKCRHLLLELHESALKSADGNSTTTVATTGVSDAVVEEKVSFPAHRFAARHDYSPLTMACVGGTLALPDLHPLETESLSAFLGGDGSVECGKVVDKVFRWAEEKTNL